MKPVKMRHIAINDNYIKRAADNTVNYLLSLEPERFLYEIYRVAGLKPLTEAGYGGWERSNAINFRGHFFGHYISALAQAYEGSQDDLLKHQLHEKLAAAVSGLAAAQDAYGKAHPESAGYVSAFREAALDEVEGKTVPAEEKENVLVPWYDLHKILAGLMDAYTYLQEDDAGLAKQALEAAVKFGDYVYRRLEKVEDKETILKTEYGGMNDALYRLFALTGRREYRICASWFDEMTLFEALAKGEDALPEKHGNTMIPKLIGASRQYLVLKPEAAAGKLSPAEIRRMELCKTAAVNFWDITLRHHTYVTGGNTQSEHFHRADEQYHDAEIRVGNCTCETCNTHNMLKLSRNLYEITGAAKYLDYYEKTYINAILASQNPETGMMMYFQPMGSGYNKVYNRPFDEFWCCTGTGIESFTKLSDSWYFWQDDALVINLYFSNTLKLPEYNILLTLEVERSSGEFKITRTPLDPALPVRPLRLALRQPSWCPVPVLKLKCSAKAVQTVSENGFLFLPDFPAGEELTGKFEMSLEVHAAGDNENYAAFTYGPYVLAGELGSHNIWEDRPNGILVRVGTKDEEAGRPLIVRQSVSTWKQNLPGRAEVFDDEQYLLRIKLPGLIKELSFVPYYEIYNRRYGIYFNLFEEGSAAEASWQAEQARRQAEKSRWSDYLDNFDHNNAEFARELESNQSEVGVHRQRRYRRALAGGWFSYKLPVAADPDAGPCVLVLAFSPDDKGQQIVVRTGAAIHEITVAADVQEGDLCRVEIPVTQMQAVHDGKLQVRFEAPDGGDSSRVFGVGVRRR